MATLFYFIPGILQGSQQRQDLGDDGQGDGDLQLRISFRTSTDQKNKNYTLVCFELNTQI